MESKLIDHKELKDGPLGDRGCTDILCCFIFFVFLGAMITLGVFGFQNGDSRLLLYPFDSSGNQCGRDGTKTEDFPYVYFLNPNYGGEEMTYKVCVKNCEVKDKKYDCYPNDFVVDCDFTVKKDNVSQPFEPYAADNFLKRVCIPKEGHDSLTEKINSSQMMSFGTDVIRCWYIVLAVLGIAVGISLLYLLLLRYFIGVIVWIVIVALIVLMLLFGGYFSLHIHKGGLENSTKIEYWAISISAYALALLFVVVVVCLRKRIELAVAVMKSATIFIEDVWTSLLVPIVMFFVSAIIFAFWIYALVCLYSSGTLKEGNNSVVAKLQLTTELKNALWFEVLGIVWVNSFQVALLQFIISYACCVWYFTEDKDNLDRPIWRGVKTGLIYHIGSLAFGSLLLSIVIIVKWLISIIASMNKPVGEDFNAVAKCCCKCAACCLDCFERFVKFLDHQAYIRIALTGKSFCICAKEAFEMIWENAGRFTALGGVGAIFNNLGKALITCLSAYFGFLIITHVSEFADSIYSPVGPTIIFLLVSYLVSCLFMGVYEIAADTIIQAFIIDEKIHGENNANYAPEPIKEYLKDCGKD